MYIARRRLEAFLTQPTEYHGLRMAGILDGLLKRIHQIYPPIFNSIGFMHRIFYLSLLR